MRSNKRGAFSGVSTTRSWAPFFCLSRGIKLARPKLYFRRNSRHLWAPAVVWTTMLSNMPQAVEIATSYFSLIDAKSPSRPKTPTFESSPPFFEALRIPCTALERDFPPPATLRDCFASSTLVFKSSQTETKRKLQEKWTISLFHKFFHLVFQTY